jgi:hypothetical protein
MITPTLLQTPPPGNDHTPSVTPTSRSRTRSGRSSARQSAHEFVQRRSDRSFLGMKPEQTRGESGPVRGGIRLT